MLTVKRINGSNHLGIGRVEGDPPDGRVRLDVSEVRHDLDDPDPVRHCLSLSFHCPFTAFQCPFTLLSLSFDWWDRHMLRTNGNMGFGEITEVRRRICLVCSAAFASAKTLPLPCAFAAFAAPHTTFALCPHCLRDG